MVGKLVSLRVANAAPCRFFLTWTVVGWRRFRPPSGHLEFVSMSIMIGTTTIRTIGRICWQPSELSVEERICRRVQTSFSPYRWMLLY